MKEISTITIEHITVTSNKSYKEVREIVENNMVAGDALLHYIETTKATEEQIQQTIEELLGQKMFFIFCTIEHGHFLTLTGKYPRKAVQYTLGNPLLAAQMIQHVSAVTLYAPFKLAVYEYDTAKTIITYDRFSSLVAGFHNEEVTRVATHIDQVLEDLIATIIY